MRTENTDLDAECQSDVGGVDARFLYGDNTMAMHGRVLLFDYQLQVLRIRSIVRQRTRLRSAVYVHTLYIHVHVNSGGLLRRRKLESFSSAAVALHGKHRQQLQQLPSRLASFDRTERNKWPHRGSTNHAIAV